ncbi:MAG: pectate lyase [Chthoniobacteraceae bacterium]
MKSVLPSRSVRIATFLCLALLASSPVFAAEKLTRDQAVAAMKKAATFYRTKAASHGGYVYYYAPDFSWRLGEGKATKDQIFVQPPGTPTVGLAYLKAFEATGDTFYLDAAREAAEALVYGQLASGGWMQTIDFAPKGGRVGKYRNGKGGDWNASTFDDGISPSALCLIMHTDRALTFKHREIHECSESGRAAMLAAQFAHGAFPQVWTGPIAAVQQVKAQYPDYDWHIENHLKNYWDMPTLNDDVASFEAQALADAWDIYKDERCRAALAKLGDFLILAQMPEPQPAWAQQYDTQMRPIWARKFEPPAIAGRESLGVIETLIFIHSRTGDAKYLEPIPRALAYLKRSLLPDGRLARYYELKTNKPLYMTRDYKLTFDDADLPEHYGWKWEPKLDALEAAFAAAKSRAPAPKPTSGDSPEQILRELDPEGRWVSTFVNQRLVGNPKFKAGEQFIASEVFSRNLEALSELVAQPR